MSRARAFVTSQLAVVFLLLFFPARSLGASSSPSLPFFFWELAIKDWRCAKTGRERERKEERKMLLLVVCMGEEKECMNQGGSTTVMGTPRSRRPKSERSFTVCGGVYTRTFSSFSFFCSRLPLSSCEKSDLGFPTDTRDFFFSFSLFWISFFFFGPERSKGRNEYASHGLYSSFLLGVFWWDAWWIDAAVAFSRLIFSSDSIKTFVNVERLIWKSNIYYSVVLWKFKESFWIVENLNFINANRKFVVLILRFLSPSLNYLVKLHSTALEKTS